jgi:hypothetical protein
VECSGRRLLGKRTRPFCVELTRGCMPVLLRGSEELAIRTDIMLLAKGLPELGSDLIPALASD